ncbi:MAG TPA: hypothetical protein VFA85_02275 [Terriglobales bacterium]|nr:hypothetical protein [Terriglobales bacterium]
MSSTQSLGPNHSDLLGNFNIEAYIAIAKRRKWWIILPAIGMFFLVAAAVRRFPNVYRAETVIMVDPQQVPDKFVASTVSSTIADRLPTIQQQVLSPTRLGRLINTMGLYQELRSHHTDQEIIATMQKATTVEMVTPVGGHLSAFKIAYVGKSPTEVARVTNQIADMFIQENLKAREAETEGTADFLESELQDTKKQLDEKKAELQSIRNKYVLDLPESKQYHLEALATLRNQLEASEDRVRADQQQKVLLQSMASSVSLAPTVDLDEQGEGGAQASPDELELRKLEANLSALRSRYGPSFPDVKKAQAEIDQLHSKIAAEQKAGTEQPALIQSAPPKHPSNPVVDAQVNKLDEEIAEQTKLQPQLQAQINEHISKLEQVPIFEDQIAGIMQDYDTLRTHYQGLLDKKLAADMANALEARQKAERFVILDAAVPPEKPFGPNRMLFSLGGLFAGLGAGIAMAMLLETSDDSIRSESDVATLLKQSVLTGIPLITTRHRRGRQVLHAGLGVLATAVGSAMLGTVLSRFLAPFF